VGFSGLASPGASEGVRAQTNGAMVGPRPKGESGVPSAAAESWGSLAQGPRRAAVCAPAAAAAFGLMGSRSCLSPGREVEVRSRRPG
jgi:hypothetical protein